ncbi:MAG TPA: hypothetical protein VIG51_12335 [Candidatus Baltobacteraceae bacterium]
MSNEIDSVLDQYLGDWILDLQSPESASMGAADARIWEAIRHDYAAALIRSN